MIQYCQNAEINYNSIFVDDSQQKMVQSYSIMIFGGFLIYHFDSEQLCWSATKH